MSNTEYTFNFQNRFPYDVKFHIKYSVNGGKSYNNTDTYTVKVGKSKKVSINFTGNNLDYENRWSPYIQSVKDPDNYLYDGSNITISTYSTLYPTVKSINILLYYPSNFGDDNHTNIGIYGEGNLKQSMPDGYLFDSKGNKCNMSDLTYDGDSGSLFIIVPTYVSGYPAVNLDDYPTNCNPSNGNGPTEDDDDDTTSSYWWLILVVFIIIIIVVVIVGGGYYYYKKKNE